MGFKHLDHLQLAWQLLEELPPPDALRELEKRLVAIATAAGRPEKYDGAMTRAYLSLIAERRRAGESFAAFVARNQDLLLDGAALVARVLALRPC